MAITSKILGERGRRQAKDLGVDPARIPPGQYLTSRFPVLTYGRNPKIDLASWSLSVWGEVDRPYSLTWDELLALPQTEVTADIHCVTRWSKLDNTWEGVSAREIMSRTKVRPEARFVLFHADGGYTANIPLATFDDDAALLAIKHDGEELSPEHGFPLRAVVPSRYAWKSAKWLRGIEFLAEDRLGFWEKYGYNSNADPWNEERFAE